MANFQASVNSGAAAHALARWIQDNLADDPSAEGFLLSQGGESIYADAELASVSISLDGETDEN